jgi:hypothetical protein
MRRNTHIPEKRFDMVRIGDELMDRLEEMPYEGHTTTWCRVGRCCCREEHSRLYDC